MLKRIIPCQAVSNKLEIFNLSKKKLASIRRLERVLVTRILFNKVAIMSKGKLPKIRGTI